MRFVAALSAFTLLLSAQTSGPSQRELNWRQDFAVLSAALKAPGIRIAGGIATKGQKDFARLYPNFDADIASLEKDLPEISDAEVTLRLMKLIAGPHIGHNRIYIPVGMGFANRLPINVHWFADGLAVTAATPEFAATLGARVLNIGGRPVEQLMRDIAPYISFETTATLRTDAPALLNAAGVLRHFQMVSDAGTVPLLLQTPTGESVTVQAPLVLGGERTSAIQGLHIPQTLARSRAGYYWHQYLADSETLYIQYNVCENDPKQPFSAFARDALKDAGAHTVKRVVIDLRNNGGGNEHVLGPLKSGLAERAARLGPVYVLIGQATFSSAVDNAATLRKELSAKLVGEPSGGLTGGYGEVSRVKLPNSKLQVQFTTKGSFPKDGEPLNLIPDIPAPLNLADFLAGRDPALEAALHAN